MSNADEARHALSAARAMLEHDAAASVTMFERAVLLAFRARNRELQADAELGCGEALAHIEGRELESLLHLDEAVKLGAGTVIEALAWLTTADVLRFLRDFSRALTVYTQTANLFATLQDLTGEVLARRGMAEMLQALHRDDEAVPALAHAVYLALDDKDLPEAAQLSLSLGEVLLRHKRTSEAKRVLIAAADMFHTLGDLRHEARTRSHLLAIGYEAGDYSQLVHLTELAAEHAAEEGDAQMEGNARLMLARLLEEQAAIEGGSNAGL